MLWPNLTEKLISIYKKHGNIIIALDFDDTIFDWKNKGYTSCEYIIDLIKRCELYLNAKIILYTCRSKDILKEAVEFCKINEIKLYGVNENPDIGPSDSKVYYNVILDDKTDLAGTCAILEDVITKC